MDILILENDQKALKVLKQNIEKTIEGVTVHSFRYQKDEIVECVKQNKISIALLDVNLGTNRYDGVDVAIEINKASPNTYIIFTSGFKNIGDRILSAELRVDYLQKPLTKERVEEKLKKVIKDLHLSADPPDDYKIVIRTFGNLQIVVDGEDKTHELRAASKRLIAACINDYGSILNIEALALNANNKERIKDKRTGYEIKKEFCKDVSERKKYLTRIIDIKQGGVRYKIENKEIWCDLIEFKNGNYEVLKNYNHAYLNDLTNEDAKANNYIELENKYDEYILNASKTGI